MRLREVVAAKDAELRTVVAGQGLRIAELERLPADSASLLVTTSRSRALASRSRRTSSSDSLASGDG